MSKKVAFAAVDLCISDRAAPGLLFYGGEPLLERGLIKDIVAYADKKSRLQYKITTNGTLLDGDFINFAKKSGIAIGFSHDGFAQDDFRVYHDGSGSYKTLDGIIPLLLESHPYSIGMSVMNPATIHRAAETVQFLFDKGFRYITQSLNYSEDAPWTVSHMEILKAEYEKMADMYIKWTRAEEKFYLSPIDLKIISHIKGKNYAADRIKHTKNQLSVAPDGKIYAVSKFIENPMFEIGDVFSGISKEKAKTAFKEIEAVPDLCKRCAIRSRCNYVHDCIIIGNGSITRELSPVRCTHEQIITPIADYVAETLFNEKNAMFVHKHYNRAYPLWSYLEDSSL